MGRNKVYLLLIFGALAALALVPAFPAAAQSTSMSTTTAERPYLGVRMQDTPDGVVALSVIGASPADMAGLQRDDLIQMINDQTVLNVHQAMQTIDAMKIGDQITLGIDRNGQTQTLTATLNGIPTPAEDIIPNNMPFDAIGYDSMAQTWHVFNLDQNAALYTAGLRQGDVITAFNENTFTPVDLQVFVRNLAVGDTVKVTVQRNGSSTDIQIPAPAFQTLNMDNQGNEGLLFNIVQTNTTVMSPVPNLPGNTAFDAISYSSTDKSWYVFGLEDGGPLYTAGLRTGDQIMKIDGTAYAPAAFQTYRETLADSATVTMTVQRGDQSMDVKASAADLNVLDLFNASSGGMLFGVASISSPVWLGADVSTMNSALAQQYQLDVTKGALVLNVMPDSPAAQAGLEAKDVISAVGQNAVTDSFGLQQLLLDHQPGDQITLDVLRNGNTMQINATLAEPTISGETALLTPIQ